MNAKLVWYLVKTDWRRLWVALVALWAVMLCVALPAAYADFGRMTDHAKWLTLGSGATSAQEFRTLVLHSGMPGWEGWSQVVSVIGGLATPALVLACAMIGITGGGWSSARPVRKTEWVVAKLAELVLFILLPAALLVALSTAAHGFPAAAAGVDGMRSLVHMLPMGVMLVLAGALCGTFSRWFGWVAGFAAFFVVFSLVLREDWLKGDTLDLWGASGDFMLRDVGISLLLLGLIALRKRRRSYWVIVLAWPLIVGAMLGARWVKTGREPRLAQRKEFPPLEIPGDRWSIRDFRTKMQTPDRKSLVGFSGNLDSDEDPAGVRSFWWPVGEVSVSTKGRIIGRHPGRTFGQRMEDRRDLEERAVSVLAPFDDELLRQALPKEAGNLISPGRMSYQPLEWLPMGIIGEHPENIAEVPLDVSARVEGVRIRCVPLGEVAMGGSLEIAGETGRLRMDAAFAKGVRVNLAKLSRTWGREEEPLSGMAVVLMIPKSSVSVRLELSDASFRRQLLAGCRFESVVFRMGDQEFTRLSRLFGPLHAEDVKVMIFRKEVLERMSREVRGAGVTEAQRWMADGKPPRTLARGDTRGFFETYPKGRPGPESCTEQEAGMWLYRVLALETDDDGWLAREISPYVDRHPGLFMRLPAGHFTRRAVEDALVDGLAGASRSGLFEAMKQEPDDRKFGVMFAVAERRGWMMEVKEIVKARLAGRKLLPEELAAIAVKYEDSSFYPALLERVTEDASWDLYEKIRRLPGIGPDLEAAVRRYEDGIKGYRGDRIRSFLIPAANGSNEALGAILSILNEAAISGKPFDGWEQVLKVVRLPVEISELDRKTVDLRFGGLEPGDFTWSPFLRQWRPKDHVQFPENR